MTYLFMISCLVAAIAAIFFRVELAYGQATLEVGKKIVDPSYLDNLPNGQQNAITNPKRNITFVSCIAIVLFTPFITYIGGEGFNFWSLLVAFFAMTIAGGTFLRRLNTDYFLPAIHADMVKRSKNYRKEGDDLRADAAEVIAEDILDAYPTLKLMVNEFKK